MLLPWYLGNSRADTYPWASHWWSLPGLIFPLVVWSVVWTGLALWHAARRGEKVWFIVFLLVHTAGILEIIYLLFVAKIFSQPASSKRKSS